LPDSTGSGRVLAAIALAAVAVIGGGTSGVRCDVHDGYVHPDYPAGPPDSSHPTGKPVNPYSLATQAPGGGCQATTGT
jgi:hypothetical protein